MTAELIPPCCGERTCQRQQPIRLMRSILRTGTWWVVTEYADLGRGRIEPRQKHALHPDDARDLERLREAVERTGKDDR